MFNMITDITFNKHINIYYMTYKDALEPKIWLKMRNRDNRYNSLIIIYGRHIYDNKGWRNATSNIIHFQKLFRRYIKKREKHELAIILHNTILTNDVKWYISKYI